MIFLSLRSPLSLGAGRGLSFAIIPSYKLLSTVLAIRVPNVRLNPLRRNPLASVGRKVDFNTAGFLSEYYRDRVLREAEVQYDAT